jgi:KEOPS complex subunit Pcc1
VVHAAVLEFEYDDAHGAHIVERSVRQEVGEIAGDRSTATVERDTDTVTVTVEARDLVALRAGLNTWLTLVDVAEACGAATADDPTPDDGATGDAA